MKTWKFDLVAGIFSSIKQCQDRRLSARLSCLISEILFPSAGDNFEGRCSSKNHVTFGYVASA